ncbi:GNAT family N-acetyltransferase [Enterococcus sp. LJL120]
MHYVLETPRLRLREWQPGEELELSKFLADPEVMYAYEHGFSEAEVKNWLQWNLTSYQENQFGLWAMELKAIGEIIGECGLTSQQVAGKNYLEIGYHLQKSFWGHGYAIEAARACKEYAFEHLTNEVVSIVRDTNLASMNVAIRNGMLVRERFSKDYYGLKMPHYLFSVKKA